LNFEMKTLHIIKTEPEDHTEKLMSMLLGSERKATVFNLYTESADYEKLLDLIFEHDKVISWW